MAAADSILAVVCLEGDELSASTQIYKPLAHAFNMSNNMCKLVSAQVI